VWRKKKNKYIRWCQSGMKILASNNCIISYISSYKSWLLSKLIISEFPTWKRNLCGLSALENINQILKSCPKMIPSKQHITKTTVNTGACSLSALEAKFDAICTANVVINCPTWWRRCCRPLSHRRRPCCRPKTRRAAEPSVALREATARRRRRRLVAPTHCRLCKVLESRH
jgi:hypothetical protein